MLYELCVRVVLVVCACCMSCVCVLYELCVRVV